MDDPELTLTITRLTLTGLPEALRKLSASDRCQWPVEHVRRAADALETARKAMGDAKATRMTRREQAWVWLANVCAAAGQHTACTLIGCKVMAELAKIEAGPDKSAELASERARLEAEGY